MIRVLLWFLSLFGFIFTPDNHVTPVMRWGQYKRTIAPGLRWTIPLVERTLDPVKTSIYVGNIYLEEVLSRDNIPFTLKMTVLFTFIPDKAVKPAAAQLVKAGEPVLQTIVRDYTNQGLRRLAAKYGAECLSDNVTMTIMEKDLSAYLTSTMRPLGLAPLKRDGILIKELIAPPEFKHTIFDVKHDESILEVLRSYPVPELVRLLNEVIVANGLKQGANQMAFMVGGNDAIHALPWMANHPSQPDNHRNGQHGYNDYNGKG
ncbi:MAG: SPFH domain-containing protein [Anaerolineae bacterium]|nr:SPFH domain-containing protein [Anaerolineae bacterium]